MIHTLIIYFLVFQKCLKPNMVLPPGRPFSTSVSRLHQLRLWLKSISGGCLFAVWQLPSALPSFITPETKLLSDNVVWPVEATVLTRSSYNSGWSLWSLSGFISPAVLSALFRLQFHLRHPATHWQVYMSVDFFFLVSLFNLLLQLSLEESLLELAFHPNQHIKKRKKKFKI